MSIYCNVTEQDLINLRKLAEQQKEQQVIKIRNKILKETHDIKLAESLSPITKKLEDVIKSFNKSTQELGDVIKKSQPIPPQLVIEITPSLQTTENNEGVIYDVELENTLNNMKENVGFFNIEKRDNGDILGNGFPVKKWEVINLKLMRRFII